MNRCDVWIEDKWPKFSIFPSFKMQSDNVSARLSKEEYFIKIYKPKLNIK